MSVRKKRYEHQSSKMQNRKQCACVERFEPDSLVEAGRCVRSANFTPRTLFPEVKLLERFFHCQLQQKQLSMRIPFRAMTLGQRERMIAGDKQHTLYLLTDKDLLLLLLFFGYKFNKMTFVVFSY